MYSFSTWNILVALGNVYRLTHFVFSRRWKHSHYPWIRQTLTFYRSSRTWLCILTTHSSLIIKHHRTNVFETGRNQYATFSVLRFVNMQKLTWCNFSFSPGYSVLIVPLVQALKLVEDILQPMQSPAWWAWIYCIWMLSETFVLMFGFFSSCPHPLHLRLSFVKCTQQKIRAETSRLGQTQRRTHRLTHRMVKSIEWNWMSWLHLLQSRIVIFALFYNREQFP